MPVNLKQVPQVVLSGITNAKGMLQTKIVAMRLTRTVTTTKILTLLSKRSASTRKRKRLTTFEVTDIIVEKNVKSLVELQALAHQQKKGGKTDLVEFLVNRTPRAVVDILNIAWEIENAAEKLARSRKTRLELLQEAKEKKCTNGCEGLWKIFVPRNPSQ